MIDSEHFDKGRLASNGARHPFVIDNSISYDGPGKQFAMDKWLGKSRVMAIGDRVPPPREQTVGKSINGGILRPTGDECIEIAGIISIELPRHHPGIWVLSV